MKNYNLLTWNKADAKEYEKNNSEIELLEKLTSFRYSVYSFVFIVCIAVAVYFLAN